MSDVANDDNRVDDLTELFDSGEANNPFRKHTPQQPTDDDGLADDHVETNVAPGDGDTPPVDDDPHVTDYDRSDEVDGDGSAIDPDADSGVTDADADDGSEVEELDDPDAADDDPTDPDDDVEDYGEADDRSELKRNALKVAGVVAAGLAFIGMFNFLNSRGGGSQEVEAGDSNVGSVAAPPSRDLTSDEIVRQHDSTASSTARPRPRLGNTETSSAASGKDKKSSSERPTPRTRGNATPSRSPKSDGGGKEPTDSPKQQRVQREPTTRGNQQPQPQPAPAPAPKPNTNPQPQQMPQPQEPKTGQPVPDGYDDSDNPAEANKPEVMETTTIAPDVVTVTQAPDR